MPTSYKTRRLAIQLLYQFDVNGYRNIDSIDINIDNYAPIETFNEAFELATNTWEQHDKADTAIKELAQQWPPNRQPPLDRAILRLSFYEMSCNQPIGIIINDAIKLAKEFCSCQSPGFINGVLDKIAKTYFNNLIKDQDQ